MTDLSKIYQSRFANTGLEKRNAVWQVLCRSFFSRYVRPTDTILDLACGYGEFINNIEAANKIGVDLNPDAPTHLAGDVTFHLSAADNLSDIADSSVETVFTSNFLEHLPDKKTCDRVFAEILRVLRPGGTFLILGPNIHYAYKEYWDYYDHYLPLSHLSLAEGLGIAGFNVKEVIPQFLPYTMNNSTPTHPFLISLYLRFPPAWRVMGKQFFVVGEKRA
ncbi:class I SAM-dependent methyltransferase [Mesorhizobium sp. CN5-321]|jgi:SAM-dependent methyltransferase|uniref:class I SAM-dependent methyltransferase n=1 Tax=Mesorhizobium hunchu TaxID=3157708 RepID=UPI0032B794E2